MKRLALIFVVALSACDTLPINNNEHPTKNVNVLGRTWAVAQVADEPVTYRATRDNNNLNPYGQPARTRTSQAIRAIESATGCQAIRSSMYQNISGQFYSQISCR